MVCLVLAGIQRNFYLYYKMELPEKKPTLVISYFIKTLCSHDKNELRKQLISSHYCLKLPQGLTALKFFNTSIKECEICTQTHAHTHKSTNSAQVSQTCPKFF